MKKCVIHILQTRHETLSGTPDRSSKISQYFNVKISTEMFVITVLRQGIITTCQSTIVIKHANRAENLMVLPLLHTLTMLPRYVPITLTVNQIMRYFRLRTKLPMSYYGKSPRTLINIAVSFFILITVLFSRM